MNHTVTEIREYWNKMTLESDSKAFEDLFRLMQAKAMRFCTRFVDDRIAAEDIVSEVFADIWCNRISLTNVTNPEVYLLRAIRNKSTKVWKRKARMHVVPLDENHDNIPDQYRPDHDLENKELILQLDKAISQLPAQCKIVFKMVKEDGLKCAEVADLLDISVRTVHTQIYRAMNKINQAVSMNKKDAKVVAINITVILAFFYFFFNSL
ncbi:RNA polymerase sigma-70 factor (ECF subfamily) [Mucilaginibacter yixingensis]|uniref:RNA polymerase sigma-70 factor (ECF subfamily) n=1 Tax=Mucilaginibacter yixingensis TaxID=1295612 RepID=A0A2T5J6I9_9SPHI|nr:RNA polymerase sigma-70 factor [Mucilaginibacter yixingensis]PTQ94168.1 RNA polymerase sigma-70 factor (ECF subfamily) [Mucilaginibacter yixingensis]